MFAGIDIGSVTTKAVIIDGREETLAFSLIPTRHDRGESGNQALERALDMAGKPADAIAYIVSTGYGRRAFSRSRKALPEIVCHARGTKHLFPEAKTIIDIGGQDSKVIELDRNGVVARFEMNDKCAAGTGRFLEVLTERILNLPIDELGPLALRSVQPCILSSVCTVFAESEIISLLSENRAMEDIAYGISRAIAKRVVGMGTGGQIGYGEPVVFSGGVARNTGVVRALEEELGKKVLLPENPQLTAALGAALFAAEYDGRARRPSESQSKAPNS
ncbi:MAG: 2-hydroxyglutaryl-CoA dehydratase [Acidobacteria bacterium]|nr:2-hydroxyglutaryl-CoA dehydratase [Acidobacteriota bacterium]